MKDTADICEEAHKLTKKECKEQDIEFDSIDKQGLLCYSKRAQIIFNKYFDVIENKGLEKVDEITNQIMDEIRETLDLDSNTDVDDNLYGKIHNIIKEQL